MTASAEDDVRTSAIETLQTLGLSAYAARTYVTLLIGGPMTAREVSNASDVPRSRVYDAIEELHNQNLVEINERTPKEFEPGNIDTVCEHFEREYLDRIADLRSFLEALVGTER